MNARELEKMQSIFDAALERPTSDRDAFVDSACAGDDELRDSVRRLLRAGKDVGERGLVESAVRAATLSFAGPGDHSGRSLDRYRLLREIGHGGMGTVWLAERADDAYRGHVAIKLVRGGFATPELSRRFRDERQILADLRHPHVAALLDGGEAPDGTPYLVMEYIDGEAITTWAAQRGLSLLERLRLFRLVCDAVQHAHGSLVVHRDIKPSNILVSADGSPKLLDFGIAKLIDSDSQAETTAVERRLTPSYASPEQLRGERITVTTDVYSLGVLLYELLTGVHPFAPDGASTDEVRRRVLEVEPLRPSDVLRLPSARSILSPRVVEGDLDNIIAKAMSKEPERRYASVMQLSDDIGRMLAGQPVLARPASIGYRSRKFVRRHVQGLAAAALLVISLTAGLVTTLWQARRAVNARTAAESALAQSNEVKNFLMRLFRASNPSQNLGARITARELLDRGVQRVDSLPGQPALQADLLETLARVEMSLGEYREAKNLFEREVGIRRALPGPVDSLLVQAMNGRGQALSSLGLPDSAATAYQEVIAVGTAALGDLNSIVVAAQNNVAIVYGRLGRDRDAEAAYRRVIALDGQIYPTDDPNREYAINNLGLLFARQGRYREAEPLLRESLRLIVHSDTLGQQPNSAFGFDNLGMMLREAGRYDEAEPMLRRAFAIRLKTLGPRHRYMAESYFSLGLLYAMRGRGRDFVEADSLLHAAVDVLRATLGPTHRAVAYSLNALGVLSLHRGDAPAAEAWFRQALAIRRPITGDSPRETARTLVWLAQAQAARGEPGSESTIRDADSLARARLDPNDPVRIRAAIGLALALERRGDSAAAAPLFSRSVTALAARIGTAHPFVRQACAAGKATGLDGGADCANPG
jgi:serine/threonine-protein kinase